MRIADVFRVVRTAQRLSCPKCGEGKMFNKGMKMHVKCSECGLKFEREQGYFAGAMYINYGVTILVTFGGYFIFDFFTPLSSTVLLSFFGILCVLIPVFFFRYSRSLWLGFDYLFNPDPNTEKNIVEK